ncbi:stage II sporulation protein M [Lachnospiraceae bacterium MD1]|jgi:stage II sporulation protein M|uniref:Stage II sporulation protein M n=1 Tax=Variimorphobacter saccharofermentans TaxID=2755051 RepID=A0A839K2Z8_9FIRM|nr:stage II sporulation protein M [Variimorphobacter saccharofermentans]MBB2183061.1 stage II sporulation protein M [Variimorphobacter saccharofermentans]
MKRLKLYINRLNIIQVSIFLLMIGLFFGIICSNVFQDNYIQKIQEYEDNVFSKITSSDINYTGLFQYTLRKHLNEYFIFWLLSITILGIPYMAFKITSFGFFTGFFISAATMQYGMKGILLVLVYYFPHGLIYLPVALACLYKGFLLNRSIYHDNHSRMDSIFKILKSYMMILIFLAAAILIGSFLEAYIGGFILKKSLSLFT